MLKVQANNGRNVALWEVHPDHPGGEVFLSGSTVADVADTAAVRVALAAGRLLLLGAAGANPGAPAATPLEELSGVGPATARELEELGITTIEELAAHADLTGRLGRLQEAARGDSGN